jgi:short-subunit dehydrogenase
VLLADFHCSARDRGRDSLYRAVLLLDGGGVGEHEVELDIFDEDPEGRDREYARRLAQRGHDLVLVARNKARLEDLAAEISQRSGRTVEIVVADLTVPAEIAAVEDRLRQDPSISVLISNPGGSLSGTVAGANVQAFDTLIALNVTTLTRLATAAVDGFTARGAGTIVNVSSALAINYLPASAVYSGTKSYVLTFTQSLQQELADSDIRVQVVLPGAVRTEFWDGSGIELSAFPAEWVMEADAAVAAALAGLDAGEQVTPLSLPDLTDLENFEKARQVLLPNLSRSAPADRCWCGRRSRRNGRPSATHTPTSRCGRRRSPPR